MKVGITERERKRDEVDLFMRQIVLSRNRSGPPKKDWRAASASLVHSRSELRVELLTVVANICLSPFPLPPPPAYLGCLTI